jgi:hypothetical protein
MLDKKYPELHEVHEIEFRQNEQAFIIDEQGRQENVSER